MVLKLVFFFFPFFAYRRTHQSFSKVCVWVFFSLNKNAVIMLRLFRPAVHYTRNDFRNLRYFSQTIVFHRVFFPLFFYFNAPNFSRDTLEDAKFPARSAISDILDSSDVHRLIRIVFLQKKKKKY